MEPKHHPIEKEKSSSIHVHLLGSKFDLNFPKVLPFRSPKGFIISCFHLSSSVRATHLHGESWAWSTKLSINLTASKIWKYLKHLKATFLLSILLGVVFVCNDPKFSCIFLARFFPKQHVLIWLNGAIWYEMLPKSIKMSQYRHQISVLCGEGPKHTRKHQAMRQFAELKFNTESNLQHDTPTDFKKQR